MKVLVASTNPTKIKAVNNAFSKYFRNVSVKGVKTASGVPEQPFGEETFLGARNRAKSLLSSHAESADLFVGIEGGIERRFSRLFSFSVVCILDKNGKMGVGVSSCFELPLEIEKRIRVGIALGEATDQLAGVKDTKTKGGAVGYLTKGRITRMQLNEQPIINALIPFINKELYSSTY